MNNTAPHRQPLIDIPISLAQDIVEKMHAVGEEMHADASEHKYVTHNHDRNKYWDILNTHICEALNSPNCMSVVKRRGFWELVLAFYKSSGLIFTFMREQRFKTLQAEIRKRGRMTYVDILVRHLNRQLLAPVGQTALTPVEFSDEAKLAERVQSLLSEFQDDGAVINQYVIVLFDSDDSYELRRVRVALIDPNLDIVYETNWSHFIPVKEPSIVEKISDIDAPSNNPSRGLTLKPKALQRKMLQEDPPSVFAEEDEKNEDDGDTKE